MAPENQLDIVVLLRRLFENNPNAYGIHEFGPSWKWRTERQPLTDALIQQHLTGEVGLGVHSTNPETGTCKWACFDVDAEGSPAEKILQQLQDVLSQYVPHDAIMREHTGHFWHLWVFFQQPTPVVQVRRLGLTVLAQTNQRHVEFFPKQARVDDLGNFVRLPLGLHPKTQQRSRCDPSIVVPCICPDLPQPSTFTPTTQPQQTLTLYRGPTPPCILGLLKGVSEGERHNVAVRLAGYFANLRQQRPEAVTAELEKWATKCKPAFPPDELQQVIRSVEGQGYNYGCDDEILRSFCLKPETCKLQKSAEQRPDVNAILALPDWNPDGVIHNRIRLEKEMDGRRQVYTLKVTADGDTLKAEIIPHELNLPPDTTMSVTALQMPIPDEPFAAVFAAILERQSTFCYFQSPIEYELVTLGSCASFFPEVFRSAPFFGFTSAGRGWGKSTATKVMVYAGNAGVWMADPSKASFYRIADHTGGVMGFDQVDDILKNQEVRSDFLAVIDAAHQKGCFVPRVDKDSRVVGYFSPFSIVVWNGTETIPDSLYSRSIVVPMMECHGRKRLRQLPIADDFRDVRDRMYVWRLRHWAEVQEVYQALLTDEDLGITDRYRDVFLPLLTMARMVDADLYSRLRQYGQAFARDREQTQHDNRVRILVELLTGEEFAGQEVPVVDIRDQLNPALQEAGELSFDDEGKERGLTSQWVKKRLDGLGFKRAQKRTHNRVHYHVELAHLEQLKLIYGLTVSEEPGKPADLGQLKFGDGLTVFKIPNIPNPEPNPAEEGKNTKPAEPPTEGRDTPTDEDSEVSPKPPEMGEVGVSFVRNVRFSEVSQSNCETGKIPPQADRLPQLLRFIRDMVKGALPRKLEELGDHGLLRRCQLAWGEKYDELMLHADLEELRKRKKIPKSRAGIVEVL